MPCYLFTFHGHGTWMPDHPRGYVHRTQGLQPTDPRMADAYRANQREPAVVLTDAIQTVIIDTAKHAAKHLDAELCAIACEPTHTHILLSWRHHRAWKSMRTSLQSALSRALNAAFDKRTWWAENPSRKRVKDHEHFDHLMLEYLPSHRGRQCYDPTMLDAALQRNPGRPIHPRHQKT